MSAPAGGDCVFCRIVRKELPAKILFENERILAFEDIRPKAPVHVLIIPKAHFASLNEAPEGSEALLGEMLMWAKAIAREKGVGERRSSTSTSTSSAAGA